jgi:hypothetical protein
MTKVQAKTRKSANTKPPTKKQLAEVQRSRMLSTPTSQCDAVETRPAIAHPDNAMRFGFPVKVKGGAD